MIDSLTQQLQTSDGIPDLGTRIIILAIVTFLLAIAGVLLFFKMKEVDEKGDI